MLTCGLLVLHALLWTNVYADLPLWKNLLSHHRQWEGRYFHRQESSTFYNCLLTVASLGPTENSESYLILTADHMDVDMKIFTDDDKLIYLEEEAVWRKTKFFENHTDIRIAGQFIPDHQYYVFLGNVSSAEEDNFATMALRPKGFSSGTPYYDRNHLNYGLVYGIPLSCAAILMAAGIGIICWAVRRGYIRSLSWSYENFKNPSEERRPQPALELRDEGVSASVA